MRLSEFHEDHAGAVVALWQKCGLTRPWNDPYRDIARKQTDKNGRFLVGHEAGSLIATIMVGYDGHRGSINYLAVDPQFSGHGFGRRLVQAADRRSVAPACFCTNKPACFCTSKPACFCTSKKGKIWPLILRF